MKNQELWACAWLVMASAISGCANAPKPAEPEPPAPIRIGSPPDGNIIFVALSPDGRTLAYGVAPLPVVPPPAARPRAGPVVLCEARTGKEILQLSGPDYTWPSYASFSPDGKCLVVENWEKTITLWDAARGVKRGDLQGTTADKGKYLVWSPDGILLVGYVAKLDVREQDGNIHLWSAEDGREVRNLDLGGPWGHAGFFAFAADGHYFAVEHWIAERVHPDQPLEKIYLYRWRSAVDLWDAHSGKRLGVISDPSAPVEGYDSPPSRLPEVGAEAGQFKARPLPGGRYLLLPTYDNYPALSLVHAGDTLVLSETLTSKVVRRFSDFEGGAVRPDVLSADGNTLAAWQVKKDPSETALLVYDVSDFCRAARRAAASLTAEQVAPFWDALADRDTTKAFPAMRLLALNPGRAVPLLKERLRPADDRPLPKMIADLGSDDFEAREAASRGLASLGEAARPALEKALAAGPGPEARRRVQELLEKLKDGCGAEDLRGVRAVDVLEQIGTGEARAVLKELAGGAPGALTTQAAKDALARLEKAP